MGILQCKQDSFPQTYLGLPVSNYKLNLSAFTPQIAKVDKRLASGQAMLLSPGGRVVPVADPPIGQGGAAALPKSGRKSPVPLRFLARMVTASALFTCSCCSAGGGNPAEEEDIAKETRKGISQ